MKKSREKVLEAQAMQRNPQNQSGIGFAGKFNEKKYNDCEIMFVKMKKKAKNVKQDHQSLLDKMIKLKNPLRQPYAILVMQHRSTNIKQVD